MPTLGPFQVVVCRTLDEAEEMQRELKAGFGWTLTQLLKLISLKDCNIHVRHWVLHGFTAKMRILFDSGG